MWVFEKLFGKVEAFKPEASRMKSAEIFVVCSNFRAPSKIDPRFFNPKFIFEQNEADVFDQMSGHSINSLKKIFITKKKTKLARDGRMVQFRTIPLSDFLKAENPFAIFAIYNAIKLDETAEEAKKLVKPPDDFENLVKDLKLLGKREVSRLLKWREKVRIQLKNQKMKARAGQGKEEEDEVEKEAKAIEAEQEQIDKRRKKEARFLKRQKEKNYMQFINKRVNKEDILTETLEDGIEEFDFSKQGKLLGKRSQPEKKEEEKEVDSEMEELEEILEKQKGKQMKVRNQEEVSNNLEFLYEQRKKMDFKNLFNRETKKKQLERQKKGLKKERKRLKKATFDEPERDEQVEKRIQNDQIDHLKTNSKFFSKDIFNILDKEDFQEDGQALPLETEQPDHVPISKGIKNEADSDESQLDSDNEGAFQDLLETEDVKIEGRRKRKS